MKRLFSIIQLFLAITISAQTFTPISWGTEINAPGGGYPRMAEFSDGRLLLGMDTGEGIKIYESSDKGENWNFKSIAVPSAGLPTNYHVGNVFLYRITDQEWLCAYRYINDHDNYTDASEDDGINDYYLKINKSTDGGATWNYLSDIVHTGSSTPDATARPGGVWEPFLFKIPQTDELLVFYAKEDARPGPGDTQDIICKRSYDNGLTWSQEIIVANGSDYGSRDGMPEIILTPNNQLICVFEAHDDVNNNWFSIKTVRSDDFGHTWHSRSNVYSSPSSAEYGSGAPYIAQLHDGRIFVSFQENLSSPNDDSQMRFGYVVSENDGQTWSARQNLFSVGTGWWNGMFVDSENTLYMLTSGVKIQKAEFPISQDQKYYFKISAKHSNKLITTQTVSGSANGDNIHQWTDNGGDNQQWTINNAGNGYFWLEPKSAPGKCLEVETANIENAGNIAIYDYIGTDNQLWYVKASPNGFYRIVNKNSNKVLDVREQLTTDGANIFQWSDYLGDNQLFKATSTNNAIYIDPFIPYIKWDYVNLTNLNSNKVADVSAWNFNNGANIQQWDYVTGINQQWLVHDAGNGYCWFEPKHAIGKCLEVDAWGTTNGNNIQIWEYLANDNQLWKPYEVSVNTYRFENKNSGYVFEVSANSLDNGANIQQWEWIGTNLQQWGVNYIDQTFTAPNVIQPFINNGMFYSCSTALNPGEINGSQTICDSEDPSIFSSVVPASGTGTVNYQWQYSADGTTWVDAVGEINPTWDLPAYTYGVTTQTSYFAHRLVNDICFNSTSNQIELIVNPLPQISFNNTPQNALCNTESSFIIDVTPVGGTLSGDGIIGNEFVPSNAIIGDNIFTYSYTESSIGCSSTASDTILVDNCTNIFDANNINGISVYPNPAHNYVILKSKSIIGSITIVDVTGAIVKNIIAKSNMQKIKISDLQNGVYFVKIGNTVQKFIKE